MLALWSFVSSNKNVSYSVWNFIKNPEDDNHFYALPKCYLTLSHRWCSINIYIIIEFAAVCFMKQESSRSLHQEMFD